MKPVWTILIIILVVAGVVALGWGLRWFAAPIEGKVQQRETVNTGDYRIDQYEHFFDLCAKVQSQEASIAAQYEQLNATSNERERNRIRTNIAALKSQRMKNIREYNVDARKEYTQGQFRDSSLPYQIPAKAYTEGVHTRCD